MNAQARRRRGQRAIRRRQILIIALGVLLLYVVVPQLGAFRHSLSLLARTDIHWVILAGIAYLGTGLASVCIYKILLRKRLAWLPTIIVEYGSSFANRLVPAGIGAVGVNIVYFRKQKYSLEAATAAVTVNNLFGFLGHALLIVSIALFVPRVGQAFTISPDTGMLWIITVSAAGVLLLIGLLAWRYGRAWRGMVRRTLRLMAEHTTRPVTFAGVLIFSLTITLLHALALDLSAKGAHVPLQLWQAILVLAVGVGVGAVIPSPGGIGGAEAGLVVGLVALHIPAASAVTVAILYRLATYWLGFAVGAVAFVIAEKRRYI